MYVYSCIILLTLMGDARVHEMAIFICTYDVNNTS